MRGRIHQKRRGLEEVQDGGWDVLCCETLLGLFDEQSRISTGAPSPRHLESQLKRSQRILNLSRLSVLRKDE